jgi:SAM-dependent methyltransferase
MSPTADTSVANEEQVGSEPYTPDNVLDRLSRRSTLEQYYEYVKTREVALLSKHLPRTGGDVLSVGCGWHPGRHLFPAPQFRMVGVDADVGRVAHVRSEGLVDEAAVGYAGKLEFGAESFDIVLYRLVLHHLVYHGPLHPIFEEAARILRPGGAMVAIEPGLWHPVGLGLELANRAGLAIRFHGTPDDVPLSPRRLIRDARAAGLIPEIHAVTYGWRRLPPGVQRAIRPLDRVGSTLGLREFGHTLMLIARKPG